MIPAIIQVVLFRGNMLRRSDSRDFRSKPIPTETDEFVNERYTPTFLHSSNLVFSAVIGSNRLDQVTICILYY